MHTLTAVFGIETAKTFIFMRLHDIVANNSSYVNPAHLEFIAEFITSRGVPYGTTFTGISRQPGGHLSLATVERAGKTLTQHALHGRKEDIRNVSASIAVGARMVIGNGMFDIAQDVVVDGKKKVMINDDVFTAHEYDEEEQKEEDDDQADDDDVYEEKFQEISEVQESKAIVSNIPEPIIRDPDVDIGVIDNPKTRRPLIISKITRKPEIQQPILSEGLVILTDLRPSNLGDQLPQSLTLLYQKYGL
jgi:hypothetical protein